MQEELKLVNKYAKMLHLAVIKEKQIKIFSKYHFTPIILLKIMVIPKANQGPTKLVYLYTVDCNLNIFCLQSNLTLHVKRQKTLTFLDPVIPSLGIYPEELTHGREKCLCMKTFIYNNEKLQTKANS